MTQLSLLDQALAHATDPPAVLVGHARHTDPDTSHQAAKADRRTDLQLVHDTLAEHGPLTDFELADICGREQTSLGSRRAQLLRLGLVEDTGLRRPNKRGSACIVWALKETT